MSYFSTKLLLSFFSICLFLTSCGGEKPPKTEANIAASNPTPTTTKSANPVVNTTNEKVTIYGSPVTTKSGSELCVGVQVSNFIDVVSMQYSTNWDTQQLKYKGVKNFLLKDLTAQNFGRAKTEQNALRISWFAQDLKGVTLYDKETIYQVCFEAIGKSGTTTRVAFSNKPLVAEIANSKMKTMEVELKKVDITIE
ncbi:MAG: cohesin domain-containing protein [Bacteroidota bacterium]